MNTALLSAIRAHRSVLLTTAAALCVAGTAVACSPPTIPTALPEPVADTSDGAVEFYRTVQRDVLTALSAEFPDLQFEEKYASTRAECTLREGGPGVVVHLPIYGSARPVPPGELERAATVFETTATRAGFHGRHVMPPDTGFAIRMFAADGSYITFGSYVASTVGLTVGCYSE